MKIISLFKRIKNGTVCERIYEIKTQQLSVNYKKQECLRKKYKLYQILNNNNAYDTYNYQSYYKLKRKYQYVLDSGLENVGNSEKSNKIWICWFQGLKNAPDIVKACVKSIKTHFPQNDIIILTKETISDYIDVPDFISEKIGKSISLTHYSDIVRIMLLNKYGGLWLDSTVLCTSSNFYESIKNLPLFVYRNIDMLRRDVVPIVAENWLIYAQSNQKILLMTQKLLFEYWKNESSIVNYFFFHLFFSMAAEKYADDWKSVPVFSEVPPNIMGFELGEKYNESRWNQLLKMSDFHKLSYKWAHGDENDKDSLYNHILSGRANNISL